IVYVKGKGIVLTEPSVVALAREDGSSRPRIVAVGEDARLMLGRTPGNITAQKPMRDGVIADYVITQYMLEHFINKVCGRIRVFHPELMISVPSGVTSVERRAVKDAAVRAGARGAHLIEEPLAAAIGANIPISGPSGNLIITIGSNEITEAMDPVLQQIIGAVKGVLEETPPELASDVIDKGMVLTGGGALLRNMDKLMTQVTGVACYVAENPLYCVAKGTGLALEHLDF